MTLYITGLKYCMADVKNQLRLNGKMTSNVERELGTESVKIKTPKMHIHTHTHAHR